MHRLNKCVMKQNHQATLICFFKAQDKGSVYEPECPIKEPAFLKHHIIAWCEMLAKATHFNTCKPMLIKKRSFEDIKIKSRTKDRNKQGKTTS